MRSTARIGAACLVAISMTGAAALPLAAGSLDGAPQTKLGRKTLGSPLSDWTFTAVAPCRIYDTRSGSGVQGAGTGPLAAGSVVAIDVAGGLAASCNIPFPDAKAAVLNFVAVGPAGAGDLRVWPWDSSNPPPPNASVLNYAAVGGLNIANGLVVPLCNTETSSDGGCTKDLFLRPDLAATHVVIDVLGYFAAPVATPLDCQIVSSTTTLGAGASSFYGAPNCPSGYFLSGGGAGTDSTADTGVYMTNSLPAIDAVTNAWRCGQTNTNGVSKTVHCYSLCCRVPGR